jgi:hypothetical protein
LAVQRPLESGLHPEAAARRDAAPVTEQLAVGEDDVDEAVDVKGALRIATRASSARRVSL